MGFEKIIGHEEIKVHIQNALETGKISHAYIVNGEMGCGRTMIAEAFAAVLQCESQGKDACGLCTSCKQAAGHNHPDIIYVNHEKPGSIGVEDVREQLVGDIQIKPYASKYKIYIMKDADLMTVQAQNAILKTIEELPAYAIIMLLTENADKLLDTIRSRCVRLNCKPVKDAVVKSYLMETLKIPDYKADLAVAFGRGNIGKAMRLASSEDFDKIREDAISIMKYKKDIRMSELIDWMKKIAEYKLEINDFLDVILVWMRDVLLFKATKDANTLIFTEEISEIKRQAADSSYEGMETMMKAIDKAKLRLRSNVNFDLTMELLFLTIIEN